MDRLALMNIEKIGPGIWFKIHSDSIAAKTQSLKESFVININVLCDGFKCKHCQPHFRKYINENPIEKYFDIKDKKGIDIGIFKWTWEFHNAVNLRLGKYQCSLEESYEYYTNNTIGACYNCGENKDISIKDTINKTSNNKNRVNTNINNPIIIRYDETNNPSHIKPNIFKNTTPSSDKQSFPFKMYNKL